MITLLFFIRIIYGCYHVNNRDNILVLDEASVSQIENPVCEINCPVYSVEIVEMNSLENSETKIDIPIAVPVIN
jgi:hypothetical protein